MRSRRSPAVALPRLRRLAAVLVASALVCTALPAAHADDIESAQQRAKTLRKQLESLQNEAARAVGEFESIHEDLQQAVADAIAAESALSDAEATNSSAQGTADDRVRAIYKSGGRTALYAAVLRSGTPHEVFARVENLSAIVSVDAQSVDDASVSQRRAAIALARSQQATVARQRLERRAEAQTAEIDRLMAAQEQMVANADGEVTELIADERRREDVERQVKADAEARRLAALAQVVSSGDLTTAYSAAGGAYACPAVFGNSFIDSWHFPRSGGRLHQGADIFAPYGSPAFAVTNGVIDKWGNGGLGGITLWLRADNGDRFYYAHNSQNLVPVGTRVRAGDAIALVGNTGNAATTPPHIHFEAHPGGGSAANPYPFLAAICGK